MLNTWPALLVRRTDAPPVTAGWAVARPAYQFQLVSPPMVSAMPATRRPVSRKRAEKLHRVESATMKNLMLELRPMRARFALPLATRSMALGSG